jgi:hypothetical protein
MTSAAQVTLVVGAGSPDKAASSLNWRAACVLARLFFQAQTCTRSLVSRIGREMGRKITAMAEPLDGHASNADNTGNRAGCAYHRG